MSFKKLKNYQLIYSKLARKMQINQTFKLKNKTNCEENYKLYININRMRDTTYDTLVEKNCIFRAKVRQQNKK